MRARFLILPAACALALPVALPAIAADYDPPMVIDQPVEEVPVEVGSGWYLRGDVGYNFLTEGDDAFGYRLFDPATGGYGDDTFDTASFGDNSFSWGGGFGYNFTDMFRADVTVDVFTMDFEGTTSNPFPCSPDPFYFGTTCRSADNAEALATSVMANAYVDLGTYVGLTPYVGGGIGYTYVEWEQLNDTTFCVGATCPGSSDIFANTTHEGGDDWRFTYALMAGLAYDVTNELKVDLGYRYRHVDGGDMFVFDPASIAAGASGIQGEDPGFTTHEVRVGFRYALW